MIEDIQKYCNDMMDNSVSLGGKRAAMHLALGEQGILLDILDIIKGKSLPAVTAETRKRYNDDIGSVF